MQRESGRDRELVGQMLEAAREVREFTRGIDFESFERSVMLRRAVERSLSLVGEAARRTSSELQGDHPHIPWREIIGQRHVVVHDYAVLSLVRVWSTTQSDIPELIEQLEVLLAGL